MLLYFLREPDIANCCLIWFQLWTTRSKLKYWTLSYLWQMILEKVFSLSFLKCFFLLPHSFQSIRNSTCHFKNKLVIHFKYKVKRRHHRFYLTTQPWFLPISMTYCFLSLSSYSFITQVQASRYCMRNHLLWVLISMTVVAFLSVRIHEGPQIHSSFFSTSVLVCRMQTKFFFKVALTSNSASLHLSGCSWKGYFLGKQALNYMFHY